MPLRIDARSTQEGCGVGKVLRACWKIVRGATMIRKSETLQKLVTCCVILHNFITGNESDGAAQTHDFNKPREQVEIPEQQDANKLINFMQMHQNLRDHQVRA